jgi:formylglycine-generating enzyme required for sulfatase activity
MKNILWFLLLNFLGLTAHCEKKIALVIGNSDYSIGFLKNPIHDAEHVAAVLKKSGFEVIFAKNLNKEQMNNFINTFFARIDPANGIALFYYSGHGVQLDGENYMIPIGANIPGKAYVNQECIKVNTVLEIMERSRSRINFIILDACRNDPFSQGWVRGVGEQGLALVRNPHNSFVMFSTSPGTTAADGDGDSSPFTDALCEFMQRPGMDIEGIFRSVKNKITGANPRQIPWSATTLGDEFVFVPDTSHSRSVTIRSQTTIHFFCNAGCLITVNGDSVGTITDSGKYTSYQLRAGDNVVKAFSTDYPDLSYAYVLNLDDRDIQENMREYIPMAEIVREKRITPVMNSIRYGNWCSVDGGDFYMGDRNGHDDETPQHRVHLNPFAIRKCEITQSEWKAVMGTQPSNFRDCDQCPVENVSWNDVNLFLSRLNAATGEHFRLPTEAEWEFAARGGQLALNAGDQFSGGPKLEKNGWFVTNSTAKTHEAGKRAANALGIFDMSGNVAEWCLDWYDGSYYRSNDTEDPKGPLTGKNKVVRGGSWNDFDLNCRVFCRDKHPVSYRDKTIGFRIAMDASH